ncbi:Retrotrans gag domain-containing protein [Abeliophyllum distichum]|uniref:Retrotrans gag domain-containing protein n=1 Tax=Abeliophyllum distichum TaxID=126358 RepID=A0ABD1PBH2_9LAMI
MEATSRPFPRPVTLEVYFPTSFFDKQCFTSYVINVDGGSESKNVSGESSKTRKVISQFSNIPSGTSLADALNLFFYDRMALIAALIDPEAYQEKVLEPIKSTTYQDCMATITFNDDDLQLGSRLHNRPLYVNGYIRECKLHRTMIDYGSAVNIMPIKTMKKIGINVGDLSKSNIMIHGFNQKGQRAIGMIRLKLQTGELNSSALFHIIDAKTSYELLLGRVWLHETGVVLSTWYQCFKYSRDGQVKYVVAESKPFLKEESYFADAKFYSEGEDFYSVGLSTAGFEIEEDTNNDQRLIVVSPHQLITSRSKTTCGELSKGKQPQTTSADVKVLRKELTFPIPNIPKLALPYQLVIVPETSKVSTSIPSIEKLCISNSTKQNMPRVKEVEDPKQTFKEHYNPQVKKLFKNAGFGKGELRKLGDLDAVLLDGRVPSDSGGSFIAQPKYELGYNRGLPRKIKVKKVSSNSIMIQIYETVEDKLKELRPSVFDRIQSENIRVSVFERLER